MNPWADQSTTDVPQAFWVAPRRSLVHLDYAFYKSNRTPLPDQPHEALQFIQGYMLPPSLEMDPTRSTKLTTLFELLRYHLELRENEPPETVGKVVVWFHWTNLKPIIIQGGRDLNSREWL